MEGAPALGTIVGGALIIAGGLVLVTFGQRRTALHESVGVEQL